jgi:hypothetical protein
VKLENTGDNRHNKGTNKIERKKRMPAMDIVITHRSDAEKENATTITGSSSKSSMDATKGVLLMWPRIKFVAYPDATECMHPSHARIVKYWDVNPADKVLANAFMRNNWSSIVKALNVRRNNSVKQIKELVRGKVERLLCFSCVCMRI